MTHHGITKTPTVIALVRSSDVADALRDAAGLDNGLLSEVRVGPLARLARQETGGYLTDVVVVDADLDDDGDIDALTALMAGPLARTPMVVTTRGASVAGMRRLMRLGIADVVPQPIQRQELLAAIRLAHSRRPAPPRGPDTRRPKGLVTALLKGGGGSGATTLAVNLAGVLAARATRPEAVGLLDLDLQFGACALYMDLEPRLGSLEVMQAGHRLDAELLASAAARHRSGVAVLAAPPAPMPLDAVDPDQAARLIEVARRQWDGVVIDLPQAWTPWTRSVLGACDVIVLVTQMTVPNIHQAARQIETLAAEGLAETPLVTVVNRMAPPRLFGKPDLVKRAEKTLGVPLAHFVPSDWKAVSAAVDTGATLVEDRSAKPVRKAVEALAAAVAAAARARAGTGTAA
ncbi:AAA family ATPase [Caenispirillum bisanense]|uniref:Pilus assembly protein CpaE n=1 Tax=Caenispirillum bisanense TaxID=414052 RepID=A0A286GD99_9PROT|nr:hypothetical protein [Caenispirillum bisanense]SOD93487.1 pilus assembly protein CpaE [Caenispirillum bisanense]